MTNKFAEWTEAGRVLEAPAQRISGPGYQFPLKSFSQIGLDTSRRYLVKGLIPRGGLIVIWGKPKCGKSLWTTDLSLHVALGRTYRGRRVEQGLVIYITCEGQSGFPARVEAFRQRKLNGSADPLFMLLPTRLDLLGEIDQLIADISAQLGGRACAFIVLDTLNRSLIGSESKDEDMSAYVRACDRLRETFNCALAVIHHCGVVESRPRGHTALTGAVDTQIAIKRDAASNIIATVEFMKDGPEGDQLARSLDLVEVGFDEDGERIVSAVIEPADGLTAGVKSAKKLPAAAQVGLDQLRNCLTENVTVVPASNHVKHGTKGVPLELWRKYLAKSGAINEDGNPREQFKRMYVTLQARGVIGIWDNYVWLCQ